MNPPSQLLLWLNRLEAQQWARDFVRVLSRPCAILLSGPLGTGKTQLVRWFVEELGGSDGTVASPTYAIHHVYQTKAGRIDHMDLYRLKSDEELETVGFWELLESSESLMCIEWADRLPENVWPRHWKRIFVELSFETANASGSASSTARRAEIRIEGPC